MTVFIDISKTRHEEFNIVVSVKEFLYGVIHAVFRCYAAYHKILTSDLAKFPTVGTDSLKARVLFFFRLKTFTEDISVRVRAVCRVDDIGIEGLMDSAAVSTGNTVYRPDAAEIAEGAVVCWMSVSDIINLLVRVSIDIFHHLMNSILSIATSESTIDKVIKHIYNDMGRGIIMMFFHKAILLTIIKMLLQEVGRISNLIINNFTILLHR